MRSPSEDNMKNNGFFELKEVDFKGIGFFRDNSILFVYVEGYSYPVKNIIKLFVFSFIISLFIFSIVKPRLDFTVNDESVFDDIDVCKATIATLNGRPIEIMKFDGRVDRNIHVSYIRPSDGTKWSQRCSVGKREVIWGNIDGRWRTHDLDEKVYYKKFSDRIDITVEYSDGSTRNKSYFATQLGKQIRYIEDNNKEQENTTVNKNDGIIIDEVFVCLSGFLYFNDLDKSKIGEITIKEKDDLVHIDHISSLGKDAFVCGANLKTITVGQWSENNTALENNKEEPIIKDINWTVISDENSLGLGENDKITKKYKFNDILYILDEKIINN